jgi:di/tricarboxylate transporter
VEALGFEPRSRAAAGLSMAALIGFGQMTAAFLTGSTTTILVYAILPEETRASVSWGTWALRALPTTMILLAGLTVAVLAIYRPGAGDRRDASADLERGLALQRELLGPPRRQEWLALAAAVGLLVGLATQPLHGIDSAWVAVAVMVALAALGGLGGATLRGVNWSFALFFGLLTSLVGVFGQVGVDRWVSALVQEGLGALAQQPLLLLMAVVLIGEVASMVLRWQATSPLLTIALVPVAATAGIDPWVIAQVAILAGNLFLLPYQSTVYLALYHGTGSGTLFTNAQARPMAVAYAGMVFLAVALSVPVWHLMGLL